MALHPKFPQSPHEILNPDLRWFPADETLREQGYARLLPPLVDQLRRKVKEWRDADYEGASETSKALLKWWFKIDHPRENTDGETFLFQYYFGQREAVETTIYLHEVAKVKDKYDLIRFDSSGAVSAGMFEESWLRFVIKMATGSGKTKVLSLLLAWSFFHKLYEEDSKLARNFLVITPNIIVLDRIRSDFDGLKIFFEDPVLPDNGFAGQNWRDDFQLTLHIQDEIGVVKKTGNIFLTNIHRVYESNSSAASFEDENTARYFLGEKPVGATNESKVDLGVIVRDIDELVVLNDEAHHIHDGRLAWFKSIEDIHNRLKMKGKELSLQIDVTATPRHNNGAIFVQTISDYPLVEAIHQNVVKRPVLPDSASRAKLQEHKSSKFSEKYKDYVHLGYLEWKKVYDEHIKLGKKAVLFLMTDDTKNGDEVAEYLENTYPEFKNSVLVIHTKNNGEISESATGKNEEELKKLREAANKIDNFDNPYKAIVSVLMLKEGWDVRNVTTIVGLRPYSSKSNILPEQTLGRGLRRMYRNEEVPELVSVVGTDAFMDFVESIKSEGVELEHRKMGEGTEPKAPLVVEVDNENTKKDIPRLDIQIPILTPRIYREYKNLSDLDVSTFGHKKVKLKEFSEEEKREIIFRDITSGDITHKTELDSNFIPDYQSVIGYFTNVIMKELRLFSGYDILYGQVKEFIENNLFDKKIQLDDLNALRNLSELEASKTVTETFKKKINELTVVDKGEAEIQNYIKISKSRPFVVKDQAYLVPKKSAFNKIVGDGHFELEFAGFLDGVEDIISYAKNYFAVNFRIDYRNASGDISNYYPDFFVKVSEKEVYIIETKGREDLDDVEKIKRLEQWIKDVNSIQNDVKYKMLYIKQEDWDKLSQKPKSFDEAARLWEK
ncbi:MAG: type III restriction endonuclease subunit R [Candidatus Yanofskybacteria bacterium CG10_big_fil_rev_8_21_14_0_10_36_16]|uniref:Type III restriction endonuclease subunit R n=1 Tax=Candidatus Yanofskybacteria bacterium CG10_big_fil_rev_8_21_14_0_10_36_16 TaxID=1975096 RepID=A0A2J0Q8K7_9BACT|nr:MAG: type III restriction endonuclease subunit R [Candidatus Yanofskybacteria bacterium CG10_big_fil_rev_8_21_14_0_10_36_16]